MTARSRRTRPAAAGALALSLALLVVACAPPRSRNAGLNGYATDIVLGSQSRPTIPPPEPIPLANPDPMFPSFLVPPPPAASSQPGQPVTTTSQKPIVTRCKQAGFEIPPEAARVTDKPPATGVYPYRQSGEWVMPDGKKVPFPPEVERTVTNIATEAGGNTLYDVVTTQFGETTTMRYRLITSADSNTNGIYLARSFRVRPDNTVDDFAPAPPGLRVFPMPADVGLTFRSTATDGVHQTSMTLKGAVREKTRVDACGELVEGWGTDVTIHVFTGGTAGGRTRRIDARYVIVPQLGGITVADNVTDGFTDDADVAQRDAPPVTSPPTTRPAAVAPSTTPTTAQPKVPRSPDEVTIKVATNIERLKPIRAAGAPAK